MDSNTKMQDSISLLLFIGIIISIGLVLFGGILYLLQYGGDNIQNELLQSITYQTNLKKIWYSALSFSPLGIIELGLVTLVVTQILRIALLICLYLAIRDYWFTLFSAFILLVLIYSLIWRN